MDRTAGNSDWMVVRPFITATSNCVLPTYVVNELLAHSGLTIACTQAYAEDLDPVTGAPYVPNPDPVNLPGYVGFDPKTAPNNGEGFTKNLAGNQLPNTPHLTLSAGAQYTVPIGKNWAATLRGDVYYQSNSFARVFNDKPYDQLHGYTNVNLSATFADADGLEVMAYVKNLFDSTAITGAFLNSDGHRAHHQCLRDGSAALRNPHHQVALTGPFHEDSHPPIVNPEQLYDRGPSLRHQAHQPPINQG